jgi:hypothetical protein
MEWKQFTADQFNELIRSSKNKTDVLNKLTLRKSGGNYNTLSRYIEYFQSDIEHFQRFVKDNNNNFKKLKIDMKDILVEKSTYTNNNRLKIRLYNEGYKIRKCEKCGQSEEWLGLKISLILDHINGVHSDNRIENLRILCPNCNATLDTHCGKNIKRKIKKIKIKKIKIKKVHNKYCECGNTIKSSSKRCNSCNSLLQRKVERPPYEQLLIDIKELNYTNTGKKYGVSCNSIRKWIKQYEI